MLTVADTAFATAQIRADESAQPPSVRLFDDPYAPLFAAAGQHAQEGTKRFLDLPFLASAVRLRTRFIDDFVRDGIVSGSTQLVLVGAGFDMRSARIPEIAASAVQVFEIDFDQQIAAKREILQRAGIIQPDFVRSVSCDFSAGDFAPELVKRLTLAGLRLDQPTQFVWEGVLLYIDEVAIDHSLRFMARLVSRSSRVVFDFGAGRFSPETTAERLARAGFEHCDEYDFELIWRRYLKTEPHPNASLLRMAVASSEKP